MVQYCLIALVTALLSALAVYFACTKVTPRPAQPVRIAAIVGLLVLVTFVAVYFEVVFVLQILFMFFGLGVSLVFLVAAFGDTSVNNPPVKELRWCAGVSLLGCVVAYYTWGIVRQVLLAHFSMLGAVTSLTCAIMGNTRSIYPATGTAGVILAIALSLTSFENLHERIDGFFLILCEVLVLLSFALGLWFRIRAKPKTITITPLVRWLLVVPAFLPWFIMFAIGCKYRIALASF